MIAFISDPRARRRTLRLVSMAACGALAACGGGDPNPGLATHPPQSLNVTPTGPASSSHDARPTPGTGLKPVLAGLLDRSGPPSGGYLSLLGGYVVNAHWADLQPAKGGPIVDGNAIDQALVNVRQLNSSGAHLGLKLRIFAGIFAPDWAKNLGGAPIGVMDPASGTAGTIGRFWTPEFGASYTDLQARLAQRYDGVAEIAEVTVSRCTTVFAEPFLRDAANPGAVEGLLGAGYTTALDHDCQLAAVDAHAPWIHTRSDLSFNPYQVIDGARAHGTDEPFTETVMAYCRSVLGKRCVLENNSLRDSPPPMYVAMYAAMQALGAPITFQTATLGRVGDLHRVLQLATQLGASSVELPGGYTKESPSAFADAARSLAGNPSGG